MHIVSGRSVSRVVDPESESLSDRVRRRVAETLGDGDTRAGSVARSLGMSIAALQRGLRESGTSLKGLIGEVRRQMSLPCGSPGGRTVDDIAILFGFPDASGNYWLFRRLTAATPPRYLDSTASH